MTDTTSKTLPLIAVILIAGIAAEIAFESFGLLLAPVLFGFQMEPANLVIGLIKTFAGIDASYAVAYAIHLCVGAIVFPTGYVLLRKTILARLPWVVAGVIWGVILWFTAQGILAPLMGRAFMMDWVPYTWASLIAHPMMAVVIAFVWHKLAEQPRAVQPKQVSAA